MRKYLETADEDVVRAELDAMTTDGPDLIIPVKDRKHAEKIRLIVYHEFNWKFPPMRTYRTRIEKHEETPSLCVFRIA